MKIPHLKSADERRAVAMEVLQEMLAQIARERALHPHTPVVQFTHDGYPVWGTK